MQMKYSNHFPFPACITTMPPLWLLLFLVALTFLVVPVQFGEQNRQPVYNTPSFIFL
jgi:hypothetical protein